MAKITPSHALKSQDAGVIPKSKNRLKARIVHNLDIYLIISIPLLVLLIYSYVPMLGIVIAFKNYRVFDGILASKWVGLAHFQTLIMDPKFLSVLGNTLLINLFKFVFQFPLPIILALLLNEVRHSIVKRMTQTLTYLPHFLSWVVIAGIFVDILSPSTGIINAMLKTFGISPIAFLGDDSYFRSVLVASTAWKETGWSAIIYLAALTAVDPDLYAAASVDGAGKLKQTWHITLPGISSTIVFIIILRVSTLLGSDTEQVLLLYNPLVYGVGDIIGTYVYREGIQNGSYSYTTAVGLFISTIGFTLMIIANKVSRRYSDRGIW
ncbi:ABC transporter permease subunit [Paenibacillus qinlingensis]|uniref:Aldouronate transport system permease protein n=1 Tax=Paenibacillus qinlingensis TaxID=1837343 RepID=A0ABU1NSZ4_9BACL|nr:ABC transporter permease subunit [Paenibacillus qinlingensis]MDR6550574.1 putative aldouronate transport system permease protein [Paenibacillus qinlingensis]